MRGVLSDEGATPPQEFIRAIDTVRMNLSQVNERKERGWPVSPVRRFRNPEAEGVALARDTTLWTDMLISNIRELPNGIAGKQG